jgi:pimeloyl-ACP methyl ester carboxylesterase
LWKTISRINLFFTRLLPLDKKAMGSEMPCSFRQRLFPKSSEFPMTRFRGLLTVCAILIGLRGFDHTRADETFDSNGVKINFAVRGKGEPVILIHGWLSSGWINWELSGTTRLLGKDHKVIWLDMPAHGRSDKPKEDAAYGPELVEHVIRLMDHLKIKKAHIVGYSMGGIITAKFLAKYPDRALSGTLGGMGWLREGSAEQAIFASAGKGGDGAALCFRSLAKLALSEKEIKSINVPVMILFGDQDALKKGYFEPLSKVRKDWPVVEIKDANHITCIGRPQFRDEIVGWLKKNKSTKDR